MGHWIRPFPLGRRGFFNESIGGWTEGDGTMSFVVPPDFLSVVWCALKQFHALKPTVSFNETSGFFQ